MAALLSSNEVTGPTTIMQVFKIATISSVQILVLVIAGTSGFIVSLLGLIIPDALKGRPSTTSTTPHVRRNRNRSTSPTSSSSRRSSSPPSIRWASKESTIHSNLLKNAGQTTHQAWPMSRGNSATSTSTLPELGGTHSNTTTTTTSCSSSISDAARIHTPSTSNTPHSHHSHGISANALYEGIVNRCKGRKTSTCKKHDTVTNNVPTAVSEEKPTRRRGSITASSPRTSHENVRSRLSSLMIPHPSSHPSNGNGHQSNKRHSLDAQMSDGVGQLSPVLLDESSRRATLPDAAITTTIPTTTAEATKVSPTDRHGGKPPFLSRMFTFSSSSSSSSSNDLKSASSSNTSSSASSAASSVQSFPSTAIVSAATSNNKDAVYAAEVVRPRARRLSTRLVSFRSSSNNGTSSKSRRTISESNSNHPALLAEENRQQQQHGQVQEPMNSPPQTPRLGSLPSESNWTTPGSNASPLRSPLSKRSFFGITSNSPSKNSASSPGNNTLTPKSNNIQVQFSKKTSPVNGKIIERPALGRRSASDTCATTVSAATSASGSSWKNWVMASSPGKMQRRGTVSVSSIGHPVSLSTAHEGIQSRNDPALVGQGLPPTVMRSGQSKHGRHVSDHAVLPSVKEGRSLPLASMSPPTSTQQSQNQQRPRQAVAYRALSYAPPPSHAILVPISSTSPTFTNPNSQRQQVTQGNNVNQQQQQYQQQVKPFVPFHPFLDDKYHESSLDLTGTSGLTMEVHFAASGSPSKRRSR